MFGCELPVRQTDSFEAGGNDKVEGKDGGSEDQKGAVEIQRTNRCGLGASQV